MEHLTEDLKADLFSPYFEERVPLLVPTIILYEVRKILMLRQRKTEADRFLLEALCRTVVPLDEQIALRAADLSLHHRLAMADAVIYATAQIQRAELVTSDAHFSGLPGVTLL
jgi:predicted nucleic acid-binding protein